MAQSTSLRAQDPNLFELNPPETKRVRTQAPDKVKKAKHDIRGSDENQILEA